MIFVASIGALLSIASVLAVIFGLISLLIGTISGNKHTVRVAGKVLLFASLALLASFTLCSISSGFLK